MVLIEEHDENGVNWGISFGGSNPTADKFLPLPSKEEAIRILELIEGYCEQQRPQNQFEQFMIEAETKWYKWKDEALASLFNQAISVMQDELEVFKEKANQLKPVYGVGVVAPQFTDVGIELLRNGVKVRLLDLVQHFLETAEDTESEKSFPSDLVLQERARVYRFAASRITATLKEINGLSYGQGQVG